MKTRLLLGVTAAGIVTVLASFSSSSLGAAPHGGGLDGYGCHNDKKAGNYHCHRGSCAGKTFAAKATMLADQCNKAAEKPAATAKTSKTDTKTDANIKQAIIAESIAAYRGSCPCPYNTDRAGRKCGARSAYSRPGGASPICYENDVTPTMVDAYRKR